MDSDWDDDDEDDDNMLCQHATNAILAYENEKESEDESQDNSQDNSQGDGLFLSDGPVLPWDRSCRAIFQYGFDATQHRLVRRAEEILFSGRLRDDTIAEMKTKITNTKAAFEHKYPQQFSILDYHKRLRELSVECNALIEIRINCHYCMGSERCRAIINVSQQLCGYVCDNAEDTDLSNDELSE